MYVFIPHGRCVFGVSVCVCSYLTEGVCVPASLYACTSMHTMSVCVRVRVSTRYAYTHTHSKTYALQSCRRGVCVCVGEGGGEGGDVCIVDRAHIDTSTSMGTHIVYICNLTGQHADTKTHKIGRASYSISLMFTLCVHRAKGYRI